MPLIIQLKRLREISLRDLLVVGLPSLALLIGGFWLAAQFIKPALPDFLVMASGGEGGSYQVYAERYRQVLAKNGIELRERPSAGSIENIKRLLDEDDDTEVALVQSGTANGINTDKLLSLGNLYYEPLWVFYRSDRELDRLTQLKGKRIAIGAVGSGTRKLALDLLETNGFDAKSNGLLPLGGLQAVEALQQRKVDAVFVVGADQSAAVWSLLYAEGVRLMSLAHAEAYVRRFPQLARLVLPQGAIDMTRNIPARDVTLVSPVAMLVVARVRRIRPSSSSSCRWCRKCMAKRVSFSARANSPRPAGSTFRWRLRPSDSTNRASPSCSAICPSRRPIFSTACSSCWCRC